MKFTKKSIVTMLAATAVMATVSGCGQVKMGYIDVDKVSTDAPQLQAVVTEGNQKVQEAQVAANEELKKLQNELDSKTSQIKSDEEAQKFQATELPEYQAKAQKIQADNQRKVSMIQQSYSNLMKQKLDAAVGEVAKAKKIDAVVDTQKLVPTVYVGGTDLTEEVISKLQ